MFYLFHHKETVLCFICSTDSAKSGKDKGLATKSLDGAGENLPCLSGNASELLIEEKIVTERHVD